MQHALAAAGQKLVSLRLGQSKVIRDAFRYVSHMGFTGSGEEQDG